MNIFALVLDYIQGIIEFSVRHQMMAVLILVSIVDITLIALLARIRDDPQVFRLKYSIAIKKYIVMPYLTIPHEPYHTTSEQEKEPYHTTPEEEGGN